MRFITLSFLSCLLVLSTDLKLQVEKDRLGDELTQRIPSLMKQANIPG